MNKVTRIISTVALIATLSAPAWAAENNTGIGDSISTYAQTGQMGQTMKDVTNRGQEGYQYGQNWAGQRNDATGGVPSQANEFNPSPLGTSIEDMLFELGL